MALIPNFDRIVATITASDIEKFLRSSAPEDDKQRVRDAATEEIRMRLVGGYLIRTGQITPGRLKPTKAKTGSKTAKTERTIQTQAAGSVG
jgi:hypothetical protein